MSSRFDVIIAGGGMTGSALALALAQGGVRAAIIEPTTLDKFSPDQPYDLRVSAITPASRNLLVRVGVWEQIQSSRTTSFARMTVYGADALDPIEFCADEIGEAQLGYIIENRVLTNCLRSKAETQEHVSWIDSRVEKFSLEADDAIVTLENGQTLISQLLVGADGLNSMVRAGAEIESATTDYQQQAIVAVVEGSLPNRGIAWQRFTEEDVLAFLPLENDQCSIVWSVPNDRATALLAQSESDFCKALMALSENHIGSISLASERAAFPLRGMQAADYVLPRLALVGDAAHSIHPLAGQGANLGFQDIATLCEVLLGSDRDLGSMQLLQKYQRKRAGENQLMLKSLEMLQAVYASKNPLVGGFRKLGLGVVSQLAPVKSILLRHASGASLDAPPLLKGTWRR